MLEFICWELWFLLEGTILIPDSHQAHLTPNPFHWMVSAPLALLLLHENSRYPGSCAGLAFFVTALIWILEEQRTQSTFPAAASSQMAQSFSVLFRRNYQSVRSCYLKSAGFEPQSTRGWQAGPSNSDFHLAWRSGLRVGTLKARSLLFITLRSLGLQAELSKPGAASSKVWDPAVIFWAFKGRH